MEKRYLIYKLTDHWYRGLEKKVEYICTDEETAKECCKIMNDICGYEQYKYDVITIKREYDSADKFKSDNHNELLSMKISALMFDEFEIELWASHGYLKEKKATFEISLSQLMSEVRRLKRQGDFFTEIDGQGVLLLKSDLPRLEKIIKEKMKEIQSLKSQMTKQPQQSIGKVANVSGKKDDTKHNLHAMFEPISQGVKSRKPIEDDLNFIR